MSNTEKAFGENDRLRDLIKDNSLILMVISRFGIPLKEAGNSIADIGIRTGIHMPTFLCVANMISGRPFIPGDVDLNTLMTYLKRAHTFFLDFFLPEIRRKFILGTDFSHSSDVAQLILRFFDEYVGEVRRHMEYENETLFGYINSLLSGRPVESGYNISVFARHHDAISDKLKRLKDVLISYCPEGNADLINSVLFDIINCEADLISHCEVENRILVPAVIMAEKMTKRIENGSHVSEENENMASVLGKREEEIIICVAKGMSNKEIADKLCISVNTVTTHRRNICSKLDIHSPAGLTIYAIINGLIDPKEIEI